MNCMLFFLISPLMICCLAPQTHFHNRKLHTVVLNSDSSHWRKRFKTTPKLVESSFAQVERDLADYGKECFETCYKKGLLLHPLPQQDFSQEACLSFLHKRKKYPVSMAHMAKKLRGKTAKKATRKMVVSAVQSCQESHYGQLQSRLALIKKSSNMRKTSLNEVAGHLLGHDVPSSWTRGDTSCYVTVALLSQAIESECFSLGVRVDECQHFIAKKQDYRRLQNIFVQLIQQEKERMKKQLASPETAVNYFAPVVLNGEHTVQFRPSLRLVRLYHLQSLLQTYYELSRSSKQHVNLNSLSSREILGENFVPPDSTYAYVMERHGCFGCSSYQAPPRTMEDSLVVVPRASSDTKSTVDTVTFGERKYSVYDRNRSSIFMRLPSTQPDLTPLEVREEYVQDRVKALSDRGASSRYRSMRAVLKPLEFQERSCFLLEQKALKEMKPLQNGDAKKNIEHLVLRFRELRDFINQLRQDQQLEPCLMSLRDKVITPGMAPSLSSHRIHYKSLQIMQLRVEKQMKELLKQPYAKRLLAYVFESLPSEYRGLEPIQAIVNLFYAEDLSFQIRFLDLVVGRLGHYQDKVKQDYRSFLKGIRKERKKYQAMCQTSWTKSLGLVTSCVSPTELNQYRIALDESFRRLVPEQKLFGFSEDRLKFHLLTFRKSPFSQNIDFNLSLVQILHRLSSQLILCKDMWRDETLSKGMTEYPKTYFQDIAELHVLIDLITTYLAINGTRALPKRASGQRPQRSRQIGQKQKKTFKQTPYLNPDSGVRTYPLPTHTLYGVLNPKPVPREKFERSDQLLNELVQPYLQSCYQDVVSGYTGSVVSLDNIVLTVAQGGQSVLVQNFLREDGRWEISFHPELFDYLEHSSSLGVVVQYLLMTELHQIMIKHLNPKVYRNETRDYYELELLSSLKAFFNFGFDSFEQDSPFDKIFTFFSSIDVEASLLAEFPRLDSWSASLLESKMSLQNLMREIRGKRDVHPRFKGILDFNGLSSELQNLQSALKAMETLSKMA